MLSAVSSRVRNIFGNPFSATAPKKRSLEEESEKEESSEDGEGEPARKKSRSLRGNNETPVTRSYMWNFRKFVSGSVSGVYSWMSQITSPSPSREDRVNSTDASRHKLRIKMTGSTNPSKREKGKTESTTASGESISENITVTSGTESTAGIIADDDEVQFLGMTPRVVKNDLPTKRPALSRRSLALELNQPSLSSINSNFRFKKSISPVASEDTPDVTARLSHVEPSNSFLKNSLAGRKVYTNPRKPGALSRDPMKSLHDKYFGKHKKNPISAQFITGRGRSCTQESFRYEDKMRYLQLLQQYTDSPISPSSHVRKVSSSSFSTFSSCSTTSISPLAMVTKTRLNSIWTSEKRQQLEGYLNKITSSSEPIADATASGLQEPVLQKKSHDLAVVDMDRTESSNSIQSIEDSEAESVIFVEEVTKPTSSRNSLEERLLESPFYNSEWLKDLREKYEVRAKTNDTEIVVVAEMQKKLEDLRKNCQSSLEDRITRRMKHLNLTFPSKVEEILPEEETEEEEFVELTTDMEDIIDDALEKDPASEVLVDKFNIKITRRDIATLAGLNWLNDEVINFYMNLLMERGKNDNYPSVYAFNTFFYPKLVKSGYQSVQRWTKKVDVFSYDILFVPVHLEMHWCLATIDFQNKSVRYYDSMLGNNNRCLEALLEYLQSEHQDKKRENYIISDWTLENVKDIPQQMNGSDCGMFACKFAEYLSRQACITFKQQHMPYFRRRMVYEIVRARLL
ncbi:sentrin-specific protease 1-like isoform X5 [Panulirus ornatus]|uniref:sentrin-specific protease 1-like isoform X5 n=1 Tax=Panulirus ornatus TaxID=150431 RepID=UPI003A84F125